MENIESVMEVRVQNQEVDYRGNYQIASLFSNLSDLATVNAIDINIWNESYLDKLGFVLSKETIIMKRPIKVGELVSFHTRASGYRRVLFSRNYWINDEEGNEIASIYSIWTLIDIQNRKIVQAKKVGLEIPEIKPYDYTIQEYHEIKKDLPLEYVMDRTVLYSDVDVNQHMNNSRYLQWVNDALDFKMFSNHFFKEFSVAFKKEMPPYTTAKIYRYVDDEYVKVVFKSIDEDFEYFEFGGYIGSF